MAKELILHGNVQGVFCRKYSSQYSRKFGVHGSASNLRDGTVSVILQTDDDNLVRDYIQSLKNNPAGFTFYGRIERVDVHDYTGPKGGDYQF